MLNLYYGRENLDKDQFLFDEIDKVLKTVKEKGNHILLLVPDQFTLQAERNAFAYLGVPGLMDLDILSQSRLGYKILEETGATHRTHIDKYGRHMLLTKILSDENDNLEAFQGMGKIHSFVDMTNNLISEMKQFNTKPADLPDIIQHTEEHSILRRKLTDIYNIYTKYEEVIEDKYLDTEDYLNLFISKIKKAELIQKAEIWVTGFDYFTPKTMDIIEQLILTAKNVNIVMTGERKPSRDGEIFSLTQGILYKLKDMAHFHGVSYNEEEIGSSYEIKTGMKEHEKQPALAHVERELYAYPTEAFADGFKKEAINQTKGQRIADAPKQEPRNQGMITLCCAANFYAEAETAAAYVMGLVRDQGYRYRDMVVICNDMEARASVIKRVFADYGIPAFIDKKRSILHNPIVEFILALIDIAAKSWLYEDVFRLLKTGLSPISEEECQSLENYAIKYRIKGKGWKNDFKYGVKEFGEEELRRLNEIRGKLENYIGGFADEFKKDAAVREKIQVIYLYLKDKALLPEKIQELIDYLNQNEQYEYAEEVAQIWSIVMGIFDQLVELLGDEKISHEELSKLMKAGFESVEIGLLPPTIDQVIVGTMQRTRVGNLKALIVIGANDGLLPAAVTTEGLLSEDEKIKLLEKGVEICKIDDLRGREERLAIYKTFSKPTHHLWVAYSAADIEGKELKPSLIFEKLRTMFPHVEIQKDILNQEDQLQLIGTPKSTLKHMTGALRGAMESQELRDEWKLAMAWYQGNQRGTAWVRTIEEGLFFTNEQHKIEKNLIDKLYKRTKPEELSGLEELVLSPSRLERFSRCPFAHLIAYGLRPEERRVFEIAGREIGDVYHEALMKLSTQLTVEGKEITDQDSPWMQISRDECQSRIDALIEEEAKTYREGVLTQGQEERYRAQRIKEVCGQAAWALVNHVQQGHIKKVFFESQFGQAKEKEFPPITIQLEKETMRIEGKIDRVDVLEGDYVKIIDYKSGKEKFDLEEAKAGYRLQLMLYLRAAMKEETDKPAGVFYFEIAEPAIDASLMTTEEYQSKLETEFTKSFKLDGVVLNDVKVIEGIAGEFTGYSDIIPVRKTKEGTFAGTTDSKLLSEVEFAEFQQAVNETVTKLCGQLAEGSIEIKPKKTKTDTACKYCMYKSICNFDVAFSGCTYDMV